MSGKTFNETPSVRPKEHTAGIKSAAFSLGSSLGLLVLPRGSELTSECYYSVQAAAPLKIMFSIGRSLGAPNVGDHRNAQERNCCHIAEPQRLHTSALHRLYINYGERCSMDKQNSNKIAVLCSIFSSSISSHGFIYTF